MVRWHTAISYTGRGRYFQPLRNLANSQPTIVIFTFNTEDQGIFFTQRFYRFFRHNQISLKFDSSAGLSECPVLFAFFSPIRNDAYLRPVHCRSGIYLNYCNSIKRGSFDYKNINVKEVCNKCKIDSPGQCTHYNY